MVRERERMSISRVYFRKLDKGGNICMKTCVAVYEEGLFDLRGEIFGGPLLPPPPPPKRTLVDRT